MPAFLRDNGRNVPLAVDSSFLKSSSDVTAFTEPVPAELLTVSTETA